MERFGCVQVLLHGENTSLCTFVSFYRKAYYLLGDVMNTLRDLGRHILISLVLLLLFLLDTPVPDRIQYI
jgi:hypothetical protein